jgi:hypothetical protein
VKQVTVTLRSERLPGGAVDSAKSVARIAKTSSGPKFSMKQPPATNGMDDKERHAAFISALTTEHFVLQSAASATVNEAASRASLYVLSLSSSLVAMGFVSQSRDVFLAFAATVLPALFFLGIFTSVHLVDTGIENQQLLRRIAHIRSHYRTLTPEAAVSFSPQSGRWPESHSAPGLWFGRLVAFFTTAATMISFINAIVAGAGVALLAGNLLGGVRTSLAVALGVATALILIAAFLVFQRWRYRTMGDIPVTSEMERRTE